jgi:hypothetical protein
MAEKIAQLCKAALDHLRVLTEKVARLEAENAELKSRLEKPENEQ